MTRDDKSPQVSPKDPVTKQELTEEQLASIAGGRAAAAHDPESMAAAAMPPKAALDRLKAIK